MKFLLFIYPQIVPNLYEFLCSYTREDILKKVWKFWGSIDFHSRKKNTMEGNGASELSHILQNIFLCVQQNKYIHTGLELLEGE